MWRLSIGLTSVLLSILCAAHALGLFPDVDKEILKRRQSIVEALTLNFATALHHGEDAGALKALAETVMERNPEIVSIGIRKSGGSLIVEVGEHETAWQAGLDIHSTPTHWHVPIAVNEARWGEVEVICRPLHRAGLLGLLDMPLLRLAAFTLVVGFVGTHLYLRRILRQSGARNNSVIPDRVKETLNTVVEGVLVLDNRERIAFANDAFARTAGVSSEQLQGTRASDLPWKKGSDLPWNRVLQDGKSLLGSVLRLRKEHEKSRIVSVNSTGIRDDKGACLGALATFDDMTPIQNRNTQLRQLLRRLDRSRRKIIHQRSALKKAKESAESANKAKGDFLANVSHEIRTPMNAILGMTDVLLESRMAPDQKEHLETVKASADALLVLINDLLDFSKIEAGKFTLDPIDFDVRDCVGDTLKALALRAHDKDLELACDIAPDVASVLIGDPGRLRQILINLVGNAIKFTSAGEVVVQARVNRRNGQLVEVQFTVRDTGIGIPADKLQLIFDPFTQADGSTTRKFGGTGLGLTICARLVELMEGRIWVESEVGKGSQFHFTATFGLPENQVNRVGDALLAGQHVLVVDKSATSRAILADMLQQLGMKPTVVTNSEEADLDNSNFAVALVDASLDESFDLMQRLSERTVTIPILRAGQRVQEPSRSHGLDTVLVKPFKQSDLLRVLRTSLSEDDAEQTSDHSLHGRELPRLRILLVDDNAFNRRVGLLKLEKHSEVVRAVGGGLEALTLLENERFNLLLLDLQMPEMDGYEVAAAVRQRESASGPFACGHPLPIIAMTAHAIHEVRQRCKEAGMEGYVVKPIRDHELWMEIERVTAQHAHARPSRQTESPSASFDPAVALARVGGDAALLHELLEVFIKDCAALTAEIQSALGNGDSVRVSRAAHTFKGMFGFFGAQPATEKAVQLESLSKQGDLGQVRDVLTELQREIQQIEHVFGAH